jgi:RimJ/RimL family protein N-acetyltransferase
MKKRPALETERLVLRPFTEKDAPTVQRLCSNRAIADTTLNIPHPYELEAAQEWIATHQDAYEQGTGVNFAIVRGDDHVLVGAIGLVFQPDHARAEMGYWIGKPYWNQGYGTEAAGAVLQYAFETRDLNRVYAHHLTRNPASGRIMQKIGMRHEGQLRQHVKKWDIFEDLEVYGILKSDYEVPGS